MDVPSPFASHEPAWKESVVPSNVKFLCPAQCSGGSSFDSEVHPVWAQRCQAVAVALVMCSCRGRKSHEMNEKEELDG